MPTTWPSNYILDCFQKSNGKYMFTKYLCPQNTMYKLFMHTTFYSETARNWNNPMSTNRWMDKPRMVYSYSRLVLSKNTKEYQSLRGGKASSCLSQMTFISPCGVTNVPMHLSNKSMNLQTQCMTTTWDCKWGAEIIGAEKQYGGSSQKQIENRVIIWPVQAQFWGIYPDKTIIQKDTCSTILTAS